VAAGVNAELLIVSHDKPDVMKNGDFGKFAASEHHGSV
jgi:hypothetical protein